MAIPTPRSYQTILSDLIATFVSRYGISSLQVGGPILTFLEANGQSQARSTQDIFATLAARNLDSSEGQALDLIGAEEGRQGRRITAAPAFGYVSISDSSFTKQWTSLYSGAVPPVLGTLSIVVSDASSFYEHGGTNAGSLYIGRGTPNSEGPLSYTAITPNTWPNPSYYTITLSTPTTKYHNLSETVVIANGGNRLISAGTLVQTDRSATVDTIQCAVAFASELPDGEDSVDNILVIATTPGDTVIPKGALNSFLSLPFSGAQVTNPSAIANGQRTESDEEYRARIKAIRASKFKATELAIKTAVKGIASETESKRVASSSFVANGVNSVLYIDDGGGYEESKAAVSIECLEASASGGEDRYALSQRPIARAAVISAAAPWNFSSYVLGAQGRGFLAKLSVKTDSGTYEHNFDLDDFANPIYPEPHEIVTSINADATFGARVKTVNAGQSISLEPKAGSSVQVVAASEYDANAVLGFPANTSYNVRLYKNDRPLAENGTIATLASNLPSEWQSFTGSQTLTLAVDGTPAQTYTFTDAAFAANTTYGAISNSVPVMAWATVINKIVPGINATVAAGRLYLTSNSGPSSRASISITGGTLVTNRVFDVAESTGTNNDYTLDAARGIVTLSVPLSVGDILYAGSLNTEAFVETSAFTTCTTAASGKIWAFFDSSASIVPTGISAGSQMTTTRGTGTPVMVSLEAPSGSGLLDNVRQGDWMIAWDSALTSRGISGAWKVAYLLGDAVLFETGEATPVTVATPFALADGGLVFVRSKALANEVTIPSGTYTPYDLAAAITSAGVSAESTARNTVRIMSPTLGDGSALVVSDNVSAAFGFPLRVEATATESHAATIQSEECLIGVNGLYETNGVGSTKSEIPHSGFTLAPSEKDSIVLGIDFDTIAAPRRSSNAGFTSVTANDSGGTLTTRDDAVQKWTEFTRYAAMSPLSLCPGDTLSVTLDEDYVGKKMNVPMSRKLSPVDSNFSSTPTFKDGDNIVLGVPQALAATFGDSYDFTDWALFMRARTKTGVNVADLDTAKTILWRSKRYGVDGEYVKVRFDYPRAPLSSTAVCVSDHEAGTPYTRANIRLASGSARTVPLTTTMRVGQCRVEPYPGISASYLVFGYATASGSRAGSDVTLVLTLPSGLTDHGLANGDWIFLTSTDPNYQSGSYQITSHTANSVTFACPGPAVALGTTAYITSYDNPYSGADFTLTGAGVALDDIVVVNRPLSPIASASGSDMFMPDLGVGRVMTLGDRHCVVWSDNGDTMPADVTIPSWVTIGRTDALVFFPLATTPNRPENIVAAINAQDSAIVSGTLIGAGGVGNEIIRASWDADGMYSGSTADSSNMSQLTNGIAYIYSSAQPGGAGTDYRFTLKDNPTNAKILSTADWSNEIVYGVPVTPARVVSYLNAKGISNLSVNADVKLCEEDKRIQITTNTPGSSGSVVVNASTANTATARVLGTTTTTAVASTIPVSVSDASAFHGKDWIKIVNSEPASKVSPILHTTVLDNVTIRPAAENAARLTLANATKDFGTLRGINQNVGVSVVKLGKLAAIAVYGPALTYTAAEGDWIYVQSPTVTPPISEQNTGWFRVVRFYDSTTFKVFVIDNPNVVEETPVACSLYCLTADSILPGDKLSISSAAWGNQLVGSWRVVSVAGDNSTTPDSWSFGGVAGDYAIVDIALDKPLVADPVPKSAIGTNLPFFKVSQGAPTSYCKQILSVDSDESTFAYIRFLGDVGYDQISATSGSVVQAMGKLSFPLQKSVGFDGYNYNTGLIQEVNKVLYGNSSDYTTYPGVVSANSHISVRGADRKRISVSLAIRTGSKRAQNEIADRVRTAVAGFINKAPVGSAIALSDIVKVAGRVSGVISVSVASPEYNSSHDLISVQSNEKPMVLDIQRDITVTFL